MKCLTDKGITSFVRLDIRHHCYDQLRAVKIENPLRNVAKVPTRALLLALTKSIYWIIYLCLCVCVSVYVKAYIRDTQGREK